MSAVQELAAAIREALDTPTPVDSDGWDKRARLLVDRASYVRGALKVLAAGEEPVIPAATIAAVRDAVTTFPATYETKGAGR